MTNKSNNANLYDWTIGEMSALCFQSYRFAYNVAKRAEKAYCSELGLEPSSFIQLATGIVLKKSSAPVISSSTTSSV